MKKIATLLGMLCIGQFSFGQITIASTDMPAPTGNYNMLSITSAANPTLGTNQSWNYGASNGVATTNPYTVETDTFFTHAGIAVNYSTTKSFNAGFGYNYFSELAFTTANVAESAIHVPYQAFDISSFTGNSGDSLTMPEQKILLPTPKVLVSFPLTSTSTWTTAGRRAVNFNLTISAYFLNHTPAQHVYYTHRKDSVAGWGKMRVYCPTSAGPSTQYDVLLDKISQYNVDSFYLGGSPAPAALLDSFGVSQGQSTDSVFRYNFYRKGSYNYLMSFFYFNDYTYTTPISIFTSTDNILPSSVSNVANNLTTVIFPNPSKGENINMMISGNSVAARQYYITDVGGKLVQSGDVTMQQGAIHVAFTNKLNAGNYFITVTGSDNSKIATEQFVVAE